MRLSLDITEFIFSYWGMYAVQAVVHSAVASMLVEFALLSWSINEPRVKQWFRFMVILLPIISFPAYQIITPGRGDIYFRLDSLLDSNKLFFAGQWGGISPLTLFALLLAITSVIFFIQELLPIFSHLVEHMRTAGKTISEDSQPDMPKKVTRALKGLPLDENFVTIIDDEDLELFSSTGLRPMIYVSRGLIDAFSTEHLHVAFAHEIAHIQRSRKPVLVLAYILRVIVFFNPVALIEFRRLAHEEEKVCDDIAIELTGKPETLTEAIEMLRPAPEDYQSGSNRGAERLVQSIEHYSHDVLLKSRALRIGDAKEDMRLWWIPLFITVTLILGLNYFIV